MNASTRRGIYLAVGVLNAAVGVAAAYGWLSGEQSAAWLAMLAALGAIGGSSLAVRHVTPDEPAPPDPGDGS